MSISQSRANSRGPLIAVIKIEIYDDQVDRIFLHQNDDDYKLAEEFQQKHNLNPLFIQHIYQKIKISRQSLQKSPMLKTPLEAYSQRNNIPSNLSHTTGTPSVLDRQNSYRNYNDGFPTPFDQITRYQAIPEDIQQEHKYNENYSVKHQPNPRHDRDQHNNNSTNTFPNTNSSGNTNSSNNYYNHDYNYPNVNKYTKVNSNINGNSRQNQQKYIQEKYPNLDSSKHEYKQSLLIQVNKNQSQRSISKQKNINRAFQTFMQPVDDKPKTHQDLFQKYLKQRKMHNNSNSLQKNQQLKTIQNTNTFQSIPFTQRNVETGKQLKSSASTSKITNPYVQIHEQTHKKSYNDSHYSFNDQKPLKVKILRRDQSLMSSKKSLNKFQKQKIANQVTKRLYNEGDIKKNYLNKIKQRAKQDKQQKQDKQLTHRPKINKVSQLIAADRYKNMHIQDHLFDCAKKAQTKKQAIRAINVQKQLQNCSFKPEINIISKKLARDSSKSLLKQNQNKSLNDCSRKHTKSQSLFRPSLNKMSQQIVKNKGQGNFQQRLKIFLEHKNTKLNQLTRQKTNKQKIDESGQELYCPKISSKPMKRSPKGSQIHEYLYQMSKIEKSVPKQQQRPIINQNSEQIIQQMYMKRMAWLFSELDSDQDGFISPKRICIDTINEQILQVIIPVLFQMQQMDIELNLMDFRNAIKNLHPSLNAHQKSILYSYSNKNNQNLKN